VSAVRDAADLPGLVSDYVTLKKAGQRRFKALCPFHAEKTPSFYVDGNKQLFYCFGCGVGGDSFKFLMLLEKVEFPEAVRMLAARHGIPAPTGGWQEDREEKLLFEINEAACRFFRDRLRASTDEGLRAREYLDKRGLKPATLERFQVGLAPDRWDGLKSHLVRKGFRERDLLRSGLLVRKEESGHTYDRFRNRIMFPIRGLSGQCIGFGGRILGNENPKYLNSPETPVFDKGRTLYGLDAARPTIRAEGTAILVEGYLDFLTLYQEGIESVTATLGTSFGAGHAKLLRRFADRVVVNFDPDEAGASATRRSLEVLIEQGFDVRILRLPEGEDPDAFVRREGASEYRDRLRDAPGFLDDLIREAARKNLGRGAEGRLQALREVLPYMAKIESSVIRLSFAGPLAEALGLDEDSVLAELRESLKRRRTSLRDEIAQSVLGAKEAECHLVRLLLENPVFREHALERIEPKDVEGSPASGIIAAVQQLDRTGAVVDYAGVNLLLEGDEERKLLARIGSSEQPLPSEQEGWGCLQALRQRQLSRELKLVQRELEKGIGPIDELLQRKMELGKKIDELVGRPSPNPTGISP
jgi:DNA primase